MNIGILDFSGVPINHGRKRAQGKETRLLVKAINNLGHKSSIIAADKCQMYFHGKQFEVLEKNKKFKGCDVLIPRIDLIHGLDLEISILKQFQLNNIPVINQYIPILNAKNKLRSMQILSQKGIPVPRTVIVRKFDYLDAAIDAVGGYPVILKAPFGTLGSGVVIVESRRSLHSALGMLLDSVKFNVLMIQEYVKEAEGVDYRAFVIGNKVGASMKRTAGKGEFRSNLHLGGEASPAELTLKEQKLAVRAIQALRLQVGGVDILRTSNGPVVMEVNANPGFRDITEVTGIDVAKKLVQYAVKFAGDGVKSKKKAKK